MDIDSLWLNYSQTKDREIKKQLIEAYVYLVQIIAGRMYNFYGTKIEYDDLLGYGVLGLIDSIDKFDITKNIKFETYAQIRIKGAIIDQVRKLDWIPRNLRKKSKDVQSAISELEHVYGRSPSNSEISEHLGIDEEELEMVLADISTFNVSSLEEIIYSSGDYFTSQDQEQPDEIFEKKEMVDILARSIESLQYNEKMVITLYYYEELTYKEIGQILNLSESRISQIHSKTILKMKNFLGKMGINSTDV